jgi:hypothetical protein
VDYKQSSINQCEGEVEVVNALPHSARQFSKYG